MLANIIYIDLFNVDETDATRELLDGVDRGRLSRRKPPFPQGKNKNLFPGILIENENGQNNAVPKSNGPDNHNAYFHASNNENGTIYQISIGNMSGNIGGTKD